MLSALTIAQACAPDAPFMLQGRPFSESAAIAARYGFEGLELQLRDPGDLEPGFPELCRKMGLRLVSIATGQMLRDGLSLSHTDSALRQKTVEGLFRHIDFAASCGHEPAVMIGLLTGRRRDWSNTEEFLRALGESLRQVSDYARERGIAVNLEPVNHLDSDALINWEETVELLDRAGCGWIKLGMDLYHMRLEERDILATVRRWSDRIGCVQLMDDNRMAPGLGNFRFEGIVSAVLDSGYNGPIIFECLPGPDPEDALRRCADFYERSFRGINH